VKNDGASPGPPQGLDNGEAGESEAGHGGEEIHDLPGGYPGFPLIPSKP